MSMTINAKDGNDFYSEYYRHYEDQRNTALSDYENNRSVADSYQNSAEVDISDEGRTKIVMLRQMTNLQKGTNGSYFGGGTLIHNYAGMDSSEAFAVESLNKWNVFDDYLASAGFFKNMEDRNQLRGTMENVLVRNNFRINTKGELSGADMMLSGGSSGKILSSYEASLELESSTAALQFFSDKNLDGSTKAGFDELVNKYHDFMAGLIDDGYMSPEESLNRAIAQSKGIYDDKGKLTSEYYQSEDRELLAIYGKIHSKDETDSYRIVLKDFFSQISSSNLNSLMDRINNIVIDYATGNSNDETVRNKARDKSKDTFNHIKAYWNRLVMN